MDLYGVLRQLGIWIEGGMVRIPSLQQNIGRGRTIYLDGDNGTTTGNGLSPISAVSLLTTAHSKLRAGVSTGTGGLHDKINLIASDTAINVSAAFDWTRNNSHMLGEGSFGRLNQRSRIGHSANIATFFTVSGHGNSFHNLYFMHGRGSATNAVGLSITGSRNTFDNCHFGGPMHATEAGTAGYNLMSIAGSETTFLNCTFGVDTIPLTAAIDYLTFPAGADGRTIFENCLFVCAINAAGGQGSNFISTVAGLGEGYAIFRGCTFLNIGSAAMTLGIDGAGLGNFKIHFEGSSFVNVTDVVAAAQESYVTFQAATYTAAATSNGLAAAFDHTA